VRPYLYRKQFEASEIINDHAHEYSKNIKNTIREVQSMGCEWCGKSFRHSVDCFESLRDEVFDCEHNHGPYCRECWDEFNEQCIHCNCKECGVQLSKYIESFEDIPYEIFDCHNNHGPFCFECWNKSSNQCPELAKGECPPVKTKPNIILTTEETIQPQNNTAIYEDNYRILNRETEWNWFHHIVCCLGAMIVLSEHNPSWSFERPGIYFVSFFVGFLFGFPIFFIRILLLSLYCKVRKFQLLIFAKEIIGNEMQFQWYKKNAIERRTFFGEPPTNSQSERWNYFESQKNEWEGVQVTTSLAASFIFAIAILTLFPA